MGGEFPSSGVNLPNYCNDDDLDCLRLWELPTANPMDYVEGMGGEVLNSGVNFPDYYDHEDLDCLRLWEWPTVDPMDYMDEILEKTVKEKVLMDCYGTSSLDDPSHSLMFSSSQNFVDVLTEPTSPPITGIIPESSIAKVTLGHGGNEAMDSDSPNPVCETALTIATDLVSVACPEFRPDYTVNTLPLIETPIPEKRVHSSEYALPSYALDSPSHCYFPEIVAEGLISEAEGSSQSTGRNLGQELLVQEQQCQNQLDAKCESFTVVPEVHPEVKHPFHTRSPSGANLKLMHAVHGSSGANRKSATRQRPAREMGLVWASPKPKQAPKCHCTCRMIDVPKFEEPEYTLKFWRTMQKINNEFSEAMQKICRTMMGTCTISRFRDLAEDLIRTICVHQKWQDGRTPFHIHRQCKSMPPATASECCFSKQFGQAFPDDDRIMRSVEQMCTKVVNDALYGSPKIIVHFPPWVLKKCEETFEAMWNAQSRPKKMEYPTIELDKLAESTGLRTIQVRRRLEHAAAKIRTAEKEDKLLTTDQEFTTRSDSLGDIPKWRLLSDLTSITQAFGSEFGQELMSREPFEVPLPFAADSDLCISQACGSGSGQDFIGLAHFESP